MATTDVVDAASVTNSKGVERSECVPFSEERKVAKESARAIHEALVEWFWKDAGLVDNILAQKSKAERELISEVYECDYKTPLKLDIDKNLTGFEHDKAINLLEHKAGNREESQARNIHEILLERQSVLFGRSSTALDRELRDALMTSSPEQLAKIVREYDTLYGTNKDRAEKQSSTSQTSFEESTLGQTILHATSGATRKFCRVILKAKGNLSDKDREALIDIALDKYNSQPRKLEMFAETIAGATAEFRRAFLDKDGYSRLKEAFPDRRLRLMAVDYAREGRLTAGTLIHDATGVLLSNDTETIELAIRRMTEAERSDFRIGRFLSNPNENELNEQDRKRLATLDDGGKETARRSYQDLRKIIEDLHLLRNNVDTLKYEEMIAVKDDTLIGRVAEHAHTFRSTTKAEISQELDSLTQGEIDCYRAHPEARRALGKMLALQGISKPDVDEMLGVLDAKISAAVKLAEENGAKDVQVVAKVPAEKLTEAQLRAVNKVRQRSVLEAIDEHVHTFSSDRVAIAHVVADMSEEDLARCRTDQAFRKALAEKLENSIKYGPALEVAHHLLERLNAGQAPTLDLVDNIKLTQSEGSKPNKAIRYVLEAFQEEAALKNSMMSPKTEADKKLATEYREELNRICRGSNCEEAAKELLEKGSISIVNLAQLMEGQDFQQYAEDLLRASGQEKSRFLKDEKLQKKVFGGIDRREINEDGSENVTYRPSEQEQRILLKILEQEKLRTEDKIRIAVVFGSGTSATRDIIALLKELSPEQIDQVKAEYAKKYDESLEADLFQRMSGQDRILSSRYVHAGNTAKATVDDRYEAAREEYSEERGGVSAWIEDSLFRSNRGYASDGFMRDWSSEERRAHVQKEEIDVETAKKLENNVLESLDNYRAAKSENAELLSDAVITGVAVTSVIASGHADLPLVLSLTAGGAVTKVGVKRIAQGSDYDGSGRRVLLDLGEGGITGGLGVLGPEFLGGLFKVGRAAAQSAAQKTVTELTSSQAAEIFAEGGEHATAPLVDGLINPRYLATGYEEVLVNEVGKLMTTTLSNGGKRIERNAIAAIAKKLVSADAPGELREAVQAGLTDLLYGTVSKEFKERFASVLTNVARVQALNTGTGGAVGVPTGLANGIADWDDRKSASSNLNAIESTTFNTTLSSTAGAFLFTNSFRVGGKVAGSLFKVNREIDAPHENGTGNRTSSREGIEGDGTRSGAELDRTASSGESPHISPTELSGTADKIVSKDWTRESVIKAITERRSLAGADLRGLDLRALRFDEIEVAQADFSGSDLSGADFSKVRNLYGSKFDGADLDSVNFGGAYLRSASFKNTKNVGKAKIEGTSLVGADFSGSELAGADFSRVKTLHRAKFDGADLDGIKFGGLDLQGASFKDTRNVGKASFDRADLTQADFSDSDLTGADFSKVKSLQRAKFEWVDLNGVEFGGVELQEASFRNTKNVGRANFDQADLARVDFVHSELTGADFSKAKSVRGAKFDGADLEGSNFSGHMLNGASFRNTKNVGKANFDQADLVYVDFSDSDLTGAGFSKADFSKVKSLGHAIFDRVDLEGVNFSGRDLNGASFKGAKNVGKAKIEGTSLVGADFSGSELAGADFSEIKVLVRARFEGVDLDGVKFAGNDFSFGSFKGAKNVGKANFEGAMLSEVDFSGSDMTGADLRKAKHLIGAIFDRVDLDGVNFSECNLIRASFKGTKNVGKANFDGTGFHAVNFNDSDLKGVDFSKLKSSWQGTFDGADLEDANFSGQDLREASFKGAKNLGKANLDGVKFGTPVDFSGSDLTGADFSQVIGLQRAKFDGADLDGVDFSGRNLESASFKNAKNLSKANLEGTYLLSVNFEGANINDAIEDIVGRSRWSYRPELPEGLVLELEKLDPALKPWERVAANRAYEMSDGVSEHSSRLFRQKFSELRSLGRDEFLKRHGLVEQQIAAFHPSASVGAVSALRQAIESARPIAITPEGWIEKAFPIIKHLKFNEFQNQLKAYSGRDDLNITWSAEPRYVLGLVSNFGDFSDQYLNKLKPIFAAEKLSSLREQSKQVASPAEQSQLVSLFDRLDGKVPSSFDKAQKSRWYQETLPLIEQGRVSLSPESVELLDTYVRLSKKPPQLSLSEYQQFFHDNTYFLPVAKPEGRLRSSFAEWVMKNAVYQHTEPARDAAGKAKLDEHQKQIFTHSVKVRSRSELEAIASNWSSLSESERSLTYSKLLDFIKSRSYRDQIDVKFATQAANAGISLGAFRQMQTRFLASQSTPSPFPLDKTWQSGGLVGRFIPRNDPRGLFLGVLTDCCQHPTDVGARAAWFGQESARGGFFVVENIKGEVVAQSLAWVSDTGGLVFDSLEGKGFGLSSGRTEAIHDIYDNVAKDLTKSFHTITIGSGVNAGNKDILRRFWKPAVGRDVQPIPTDLGYTDARDTQYLLAQNPSATPPKITTTFVRAAGNQDEAALKQIVKDAYPEAWQTVHDEPDNLILQVDGKAVGYAGLDYINREISDFAVLKDYRSQSYVLGGVLMRIIKERGGEWSANFRASTSYRLLKFMAESGKIKILEDIPGEGSMDDQEMRYVRFAPPDL
jgi:uncharacterized protein YjbI with pentapeptide repeats